MSEVGLKREIDQVVKKHTEIVIRDEKTFQNAGKAIIELKGIIKKGMDWWKVKVDKAKDAYDEVKKGRDEQVKPAQTLHDELKKACNNYQDKIRKEAEEIRKQQEKAIESGQERRAGNLEKKIDALPSGSRRVAGGSASVGELLVVEVVDAKLFLAEFVKGRVPIGVLEFKTEPLKQFVRLNNHAEFPGLSIYKKSNVAFKAETK